MKKKAVIFDFSGTLVHGMTNIAAPGADALLKALHAAGYTIGVGSNASRRAVIEGIAENSWERYIASVVCIDDVDFVGKPAPDIYEHVCDTLGVLPAEAIVIDDGEVGIVAARAAGIAVIYLGHRSLSAASLVVESLEDETLYSYFGI